MSVPDSSRWVAKEWRKGGRDAFRHARGNGRAADGALRGGFVKVVPSQLARSPVPGNLGCRKEPLPGPWARRGAELALEGVWQCCAGAPGRDVCPVEGADPLEVGRHCGPKRTGQGGEAVAAAFSLTHA